MRKISRGFSLIEVLIVVAVIGILASLILGAVALSRQKAYNNSIRNDIRQMRWLAEEVFDSNGGSYEDWSETMDEPERLIILLEDIDKNYGDEAGSPYVAKISDDQVQDYCVSAPLRGDEGLHYCLDATGVFQEVASACPDEGDEEPLRCPSS